MCLSSLLVNVSALWACTFFRWRWWKSDSSLLEDERDVCAPLCFHYSQFRCLLQTRLLLLPSTPAFHLFNSHPPLFEPPLSCRIPPSPRFNGVIFSPGHSLIRSQWSWEDFDGGNWDKSVEFHRGCCIVLPCTNWFPGHKSHSQHSGMKQTNECIAKQIFTLTHFIKLKVMSIFDAFILVDFTVADWSKQDLSDSVFSCHHELREDGHGQKIEWGSGGSY